MTSTVPSSHASPDITSTQARSIAPVATAVTPSAMTGADATTALVAVADGDGGAHTNNNNSSSSSGGGHRRVEQFFLHPQHSLMLPDGRGGGVDSAALVYDLYVSPSSTAVTPNDSDVSASRLTACEDVAPTTAAAAAAAAVAQAKAMGRHKASGGAGAGARGRCDVHCDKLPLAEPFASDDALDGIAVAGSDDAVATAAAAAAAGAGDEGDDDTDCCHCRQRRHGDYAHAVTAAAVTAAAHTQPPPRPRHGHDSDDTIDDALPPSRHDAVAREGGDRDNDSRGSSGGGSTSAAHGGGSRSSGSATHERRKALSTLLLTGLMYSLTTGGAYGIEESVLGGGPLLTIVFLLVIPVLMGLPIAVVVAELTCAVPSDAGFLMWINLAFHRSVYLTMTVLSVFYTVVDNALYPVLFSDYCCTVLTCNRVHTAALRVGMVVFVYALNIVGVGVVGVASVVLTTLTVLPFVLLLVTQQATMRGYVNWPALAFVPAVIDWTTFITTASWNLSGLEQAAAVVEEVRQPQRTLMRAFVPLLVLVLLTYIPAIIAGASVTTGPIQLDEWQTGFWAVAAWRVGGRALQVVMVLGSILSAFGMTLSTLCTTTRIIAGVATTEVFPGKLGKWLSARNARFDTHHYTLTLNAVVTAVVSVALEFDALVQVDQCLYGIRVVLILVAFFELRRRYPHLRRPFRVPLQGTWLYVAFALPFASFCALTVISMVNSTLVVSLCVGIVGGTALVCSLVCVFVRKVDYLGRIVTVTYEHSD